MTAGNAYWLQATWFIDPANSSGLAFDGATGLDAAHPIQHFSELLARWGTPSPVLSQATTITFMSSQPNATDPVTLTPRLDVAPASLSIVGVPSVKVASGQIINGAAVVPKNRTVPANGQLTLVTFSGAAVGVVATGDLLQNATHPSVTWVDINIAGNQYALTQPLNPETIPLVPLAEVDTWVQTDTVEVLTPPTIFVDSLVGVTCFRLTLQALPGTVFGAASFGVDRSILIECHIAGAVDAGRSHLLLCVNCNISGGQSSISPAPTINIDGGITRVATFQLGPGSVLTFDCIVATAGGPTVATQITFQAAYLRNQLILHGFCNQGGAVGAIAGSPFVWGPSTIEVGGIGELSISATAGAPQLFFLNQGGAAGCLTFGGVTQGLALDIGVDPNLLHGPRSLTAALLDTTIGGGGFRQGAAPSPICAIGTQLQGKVRTGID